MIYAIAAALVLVLDQAVKFWTTRNIPLGATGADCVQLIPGVVHMTNIHNTGAAFSILRDSRWLLVAVSAVFIIVILVLISQEIIHTKFGKWTSVLVMAGAMGNCVDRIIYGSVVDMFEMELFNFAVFNVADIFITVCGILFCIHVILYNDPAAAPQTAAGPARQRGRGRVVEELEEEPPVRRGRRRVAATVEDEEPEEEASVRRSRRARAPKEDPYAAIPHRERSAHRSLEDEMRPADPEDPFAEWSFGGEAESPFVEDAAVPQRRRRADPFMEGEDAYVEEERPTPRRPRKAAEPAPEAPQAAPAAEEPAPQRSRKAAPAVADPMADDDWSAAVDLDKLMADRAKNRPVVDAPTRRIGKAPAAPEKKPAPAEPNDDGEYSLEDILNEFGDLDL